MSSSQECSLQDLGSKIALFAYSFRRLIMMASEVSADEVLKIQLPLSRKMGAIVAVFPRVLEAVRRLQSQGELLSSAVYHITQLLQSLLVATIDLSFSELEKRYHLYKNVDGEDMAGVCSSDYPANPMNKVTAVAELTATMCKNLIRILEMLRPDQDPDQGILEGFLACLLGNIGRCLRWAMQNRLTHNHGEDSMDITEGETFSHENTLRMEAQMPHLVWLLDKTIPIARSFKLAIDLNLEVDESERIFRLPPAGITNAAWVNLQKTLFRAIFCAENESLIPRCEVNMDSARHPALRSAVLKSAETCETFQQEVWRIIGWDVLHLVIQQNMEHDGLLT